MTLTRKKAWTLVLAYILTVFVCLYLTPSISDWFKGRGELGTFIGWIYVVSGLLLFLFFYFALGIRNAAAYGLVGGILLLLSAALNRMEMTTDRLHFLEHGLVYLLIYLALRFQSQGVVLIGRTMVLSAVVAFLDEGIQGLLPNRVADWDDLWSNLFAYYLGAGMVLIAERYRRTS